MSNDEGYKSETRNPIFTAESDTCVYCGAGRGYIHTDYCPTRHSKPKPDTIVRPNTVPLAFHTKALGAKMEAANVLGEARLLGRGGGCHAVLIAVLLRTGEVTLREDAVRYNASDLYDLEIDYVPSEHSYRLRAAGKPKQGSDGGGKANIGGEPMRER